METKLRSLNLNLRSNKNFSAIDKVGLLEETRSTIKLSFEMAATPMIGTCESFGSSGIKSSVCQSKEQLSLLFLVIVFLHEILFQFLVVNLTIFVKTIVFCQRNIDTTSTHTRQDVDCEKS